MKAEEEEKKKNGKKRREGRGEEEGGRGGGGRVLAGNEGGPDLSERWRKERKKREWQILKRHSLQLRRRERKKHSQ